MSFTSLIYVDLSSFDEQEKDELGTLIKDAGGEPKFDANSVETDEDHRIGVISILADFGVDYHEITHGHEDDTLEPSNEALNRFADRLLDSDEYDLSWIKETFA